MPMIRILLGAVLLVAIAIGLATAGADEPPKQSVKTESFDKDPGWEGHNNRLLPKVLPSITQDFGYSETNFASTKKGELGGKVVRCMTPCYYAAKIEPKTLQDKLSASGTFALKGAAASSGVFFGWFNSKQASGGGRPVGSLGMDFGGDNRSCGTFVTPFIPGKFRPTPLRLDGARYSWTLTYDPDANTGNGRLH